MLLPMLVAYLFEGAQALYGLGRKPRLNHRRDTKAAP